MMRNLLRSLSGTGHPLPTITAAAPAPEPDAAELPRVSDYEEFRAARETLQQLKAKAREVAEEADRIRYNKPAAPSTADAIAGLLGDEGDVYVTERERSERLGQLYAEADLLAAAVREQESRVRSARLYASASISRSVRPQYREIQERMVAAVTELRALVAEEVDFRQRLHDRGVDDAHLGVNSLHTAHLDTFLSNASRLHKVRV